MDTSKKMEWPENKVIILFDGVCNLCNGAVNWLIVRDKKDLFRFVSLQSDLGQKITHHIGVDTSRIDSILLYQPGLAYYYKSEAALKAAVLLGFPWSMWRVFGILPRSLRNVVYDWVARNRYRWFGKKEQCMIPTPDLRGKFLE